MTTMQPGDPGVPDPESGSVVPPYDGRRESADIDTDDSKLNRDGVNVSAATGRVETDDSMKAPEPADTERGSVASPSDEQPAEDSGGSDPGPASTGAAHYAGTQRGEDMSRDDHDQGEGEKAAGTADEQSV